MLAAPTPSPRRIAAGLAMAAALVSVGCSTDDGAWGSAVPPDQEADVASVGPDPGGETAPPAATSGDEGRLTGFEAVVGEEVLDLSPDALSDVEAPDLAGPDDVVPVVTEELAAVAGDDAILDGVEPIDEVPTADEQASLRDGHRRNESGALVVLDEPAALACGEVEVALTDLDDGDATAAADHVLAAADHAGRSSLDPLAAWSTLLAEVAGSPLIDPAPLVGFLVVCADGGYEL